MFGSADEAEYHAEIGPVQEGYVMALKKGERYRCPDDRCGCEIEVTKEAQHDGNMYPRCSCGQEMELVREPVRQMHGTA